MTILHLVRHGVVDRRFDGMCFGRRLDPPLGDQDQSAVESLRALLPPGLPVTSSPARRARATASLLKGDFAVDDRWSERDFGTWEGRPWADCWSETSHRHSATADAYVAFTPPEAEPHSHVLVRVGAAMGEVTTPTIVVTHAGVIRAALVIAGVSVVAAHEIQLAHLSVTRLTLQEPRSAQIRRWAYEPLVSTTRSSTAGRRWTR